MKLAKLTFSLFLLLSLNCHAGVKSKLAKVFRSKPVLIATSVAAAGFTAGMIASRQGGNQPQAIARPVGQQPIPLPSYRQPGKAQ